MAKVASNKIDTELMSHNLLGQRLGRKGRDTRERIIAATERLLMEPSETAISLSAVAREASLGMTTLYLYFSDLTELLLAVLGPIMDSTEQSYMSLLREHWPDETLGDRCLEFVHVFYAFWERHTRVLHLRNRLSEGGEQRMLKHRIDRTEPMVNLVVVQMEAELGFRLSKAYGVATVLLTGLEHLVTVATDVTFANLPLDEPMSEVRSSMLSAQARLFELGIRECRMAARAHAATAEKV